MSKRKAAAFSVLLSAGLSCGIFAEGATLSADFSSLKPVSKNLYGIFYEDINYAADGGLYGEMVQNRSFEFAKSLQPALKNWSDVNASGVKSSSKAKGSKSDPLNKNNVTYAHIDVKAPGDGIANKGYGGMPLDAGKKYPGSVYLRSTDGSVSSVTVSVGGAKKENRQWTTKISGITNQWKKYEFTAVPLETVDNGQIALYADQTGSLDIDFVSLFRADIYKNEPNGLRKDLVEMLEAMKPAFIRFPGGCIVHGMDLANRYVWKETVGPVEERVEKKNFWNYQQSYGIGFYEYFRLCEDLGAEPLPVISVGMAHNGQISSTSDYAAYAQDALDLIEYATGPANSKWGKVRADAGHPEPFKLNYIGIGNEDCGQDYLLRFKYISQAIKKKYPNIKTIISSGFTYADVNFNNCWTQVRAWEKDKKVGKIADLVDEHYYNESSWFLTNGSRYDTLDFYPRDNSKAKVFIGEYASWVDGRRNSLYAALTEAAYMTSIERNGDVVELASYAPLFAKDGNTQWIPDAIWFNNRQVYGTPNYYVQLMYANHKSDETAEYSLTQPSVLGAKKKGIGGTVGLGTWATTANFKNIKITDNDTGELVYATGKKSAFEDFRDETGRWAKNGDVISQSSMDANVRCILDIEDIMEEHTNYTYELTATKTGGNEGFLIMFGVKGKNLYWWNMGGWGNTQSCVEKGTAEGRSILGDSKPLNLVMGKAYNIKVVVQDDTYKCYLDGKLMHEFTDVQNFDPLYAHVGRTGDKVIVKIVNISEKDEPVAVSLKNAGTLDSNAVVTVMNGGKDDENSFRRPTQVAPKTEKLSGVGAEFTYNAKANSVSIIEINRH